MHYLLLRSRLRQVALLNDLDGKEFLRILLTELIASSKTTFSKEAALDVLGRSVADQTTILYNEQVVMRYDND